MDGMLRLLTPGEPTDTRTQNRCSRQSRHDLPTRHLGVLFQREVRLFVKDLYNTRYRIRMLQTSETSALSDPNHFYRGQLPSGKKLQPTLENKGLQMARVRPPCFQLFQSEPAAGTSSRASCFKMSNDQPEVAVDQLNVLRQRLAG